MKDDPRYVKILLRYHGVRDGTWYEKLIPHHVCTEADWALFEPVIDEYQGLYDKYQNEPKLYLNCIDWEQMDD